ncbi:hypothetical protein A3715_34210 [Oleiphilus sp. HI0009]|nr:hypothetical protein A3715_14005 [Oleiphilus sp. HI0009]KZX81993.1 hypothetical protein A3715_34210 [Oleiphilus sp. HI0009]
MSNSDARQAVFVNGTGQNKVALFGNYHVSYNKSDVAIYGSDTTAIVLEDHALFLILNGFHGQALEKCSAIGGLKMCIEYFIENIELANKYSRHKTIDKKFIKELDPDIYSLLNQIKA